MKRSFEQTAEFVAEGVAYGKCGKSLEVPYAFGKLSVVEMVNPETNVPTGVFNVVEADRGFSFGILRLNREETTRSDVDGLNERFVQLNTQQAAEASTGQAASKQQQRLAASSMLQQKKENDYLTVTGSQVKVSHCVENLSLPRETSLALQWGSLGFYCQGELLYTHGLWGDEPVSICASTLKDVQVAPRFVGAHATTDSLADDFRAVLAKGFTLKRNSHDQTIEFKRVETSTNYKLLLHPDRQVEVTSSSDAPVVVFDERQIQAQLGQEVVSMRSAMDFGHSLNAAIVLQSSLMSAMGVSLDRVDRQNLTDMPYYMLLKFHAGYESLNAHTGRMVNKYLAKKNSLLANQVFNVDPDLNLKA